MEPCRVALPRDALTGPQRAAVKVVAAWPRACMGQRLHGLPEGVCRPRMDAMSSGAAAGRMLLRHKSDGQTCCCFMQAAESQADSLATQSCVMP